MANEMEKPLPDIKKEEAIQLPFLQSKNFWVTIISIVFGFLYTNGIDIGLTPDEFATKILGSNTFELAIFIAVNLFNPILKTINKIKAGLWSWEFVYSANFQTQVGSVVTIIVTGYLGDVKAGLILALLFNVWNLVKHFLINKDGSIRKI